MISKFLKILSLQPPSFSWSLEQFFSHRRSEQFWKQNTISFIFLGLGSGENGNADLGLGGDIVRYLFSIFPVFNFSYSLIGLGQTQAENNICLNYIDKETLTLVCTQLRDFIANPFTTPPPPTSTFVYAQCCDTPYVEDPR